MQETKLVSLQNSINKLNNTTNYSTFHPNPKKFEGVFTVFDIQTVFTIVFSSDSMVSVREYLVCAISPKP